jgi:3',5'-cyclic AMP phosphodiesterase CpdA
MRIAVLADIHGNLPALDAVLDNIDAAGVDAIVPNGDIATGPMPAETLDRLTELRQQAIWWFHDAAASWERAEFAVHTNTTRSTRPRSGNRPDSAAAQTVREAGNVPGENRPPVALDRSLLRRLDPLR